MLGCGYTYSRIEEETGASTATISRVKRCLLYGNDGYKMALERLGRFGPGTDGAGNPQEADKAGRAQGANE